MKKNKYFIKKEICKTCGGKCCKFMPGEAIPTDIKNFFNEKDIRKAIFKALRSGKWIIDWWEGDPRGWDWDNEKSIINGYYMRPRGDTDENKVFNPSWGNNRCVFLNDNGCILSPSKRPNSCKNLEPKTHGCVQHRGKRKSAISWIKHNDYIERIREKIY